MQAGTRRRRGARAASRGSRRDPSKWPSSFQKYQIDQGLPAGAIRRTPSPRHVRTLHLVLETIRSASVRSRSPLPSTGTGSATSDAARQPGHQPAFVVADHAHHGSGLRPQCQVMTVPGSQVRRGARAAERSGRSTLRWSSRSGRSTGSGWRTDVAEADHPPSAVGDQDVGVGFRDSHPSDPVTNPPSASSSGRRELPRRM